MIMIMEDIACILLLVSKTRFEEANVQSTFSNRKFCQAHQIGQKNVELHKTKYFRLRWYDEKERAKIELVDC